MRRKAFVLALLGSTCLTPAEAKADPVSAFVAGMASYFSTGATVGAGIGGAFAAGSATAAFIAGPVGSIVLSLGLSAISAMLAPTPEVPKPSARMVNYAQPISYQERVYGRVRKGGPLAFTGFKNGARVYAVILAAHPISAIVQHWLDERQVLVSGSTVTTDPPGDHVGIETRLGNAGQPAVQSMINAFPEWTAAHDMAGLAYAAVSAARPDPEKFLEIYPTGDPAYNPVIDGNSRIYDPRDGTYKFSANAALVIAHELTEYQGREVDWDEVEEEANWSALSITNAEGQVQNHWHLNGVISDDQEWEDIRAQMMGACDGFIYERTDGKVGFKVGRWEEPTVTLTERDFLSLEISEGEDMGAPTEWVVQYVDPANGYRETPSGAWVHDPSARRVREEVAAFMISNHNQAVRVAKRIARTRRARYTISGTLSLTGYELIGQRFAQFEHAELGMSFPIEIGKLVWNADRITFGLEAVSTSADDFAFNSANEEPNRPSYNTPVSSDVIPNVTGLQARAIQSTGGSAAIEWSWPPQNSAYRQQLHFRKTTDAEWQYASTAQGDQTFLITPSLTDGAVYEGQLRNRTGAGRPSEWKPDAPIEVTAIADQTPPGALSNFGASDGVGESTISFNAPNDAQYYATRIYRSDVGLDFETATLVRTEYGIPSNSDSWTDAGLSPGTYYYWGEPINSSGIAGPLSGPDSATVT